MAMEKLYELHEEGRFDLIVVDTPPSRHALDFLDAPRRLVRLLDNRVFRILMAPTRAGVKVTGFALRTFLHTIARVVGSEVIDDTVAFFRTFEGMEEGFRQRATAVDALIADPRTGFVLVTSPRRDSLDEARFFTEQLEAHELTVDALIVNLVHPKFTDAPVSGLRSRADDLAARAGDDEPARAAHRLGALYGNLADFQEIATHERGHLDAVAGRVAPDAIAYVPFLPRDVHDFDALTEVGRFVFGPDGDAG
jgi:anion-transporting  ArsA/GET3 family ATPase